MKTRTHSSLFVAWAVLLLAACAGPRPAGDAAAPGAGGYDVVAYFTAGEAIRGSTTHTVAWNGREWHFSSARHQRMFRADPTHFAPAYDGYCAWMLSRGRLARGRPEHWAIHDGRLFLNCNAEVHQRWLADRDRLIELADREWARRNDN